MMIRTPLFIDDVGCGSLHAHTHEPLPRRIPSYPYHTVHTPLSTPSQKTNNQTTQEFDFDEDEFWEEDDEDEIWEGPRTAHMKRQVVDK